MDTLPHAVEPRPRTAARQPFRLREIAFETPAALAAVIIGSASLGFDGVLLPCPFATEHGRLADRGRASALLGGGSIGEGLATIAQARGGRAIAGGAAQAANARDASTPAVLVDLPIDGVAARSPLHRSLRTVFADPDGAGLLDPRRPLELDRAPPVDNSADSLADLIAGLCSTLAASGIDGVRLRRLERVGGETLDRIARAVRRAAPQLLLIADTAGMPWNELEAVGSDAFDHVVASSAWWDWNDEWFFGELARLRRIAPVLIPAVSLARTGGGTPAARLGRDLGLAVSLGAGWILPEATVIDETGSALLRSVNHAFGAGDAAAIAASGGATVHLNGVHGPVLATLRASTHDPREAETAWIALVNTSATRAATIDPASVLPGVGGSFELFRAVTGAEGGADVEGDVQAADLRPGRPVRLPPGGLRLFRAARKTPHAGRSGGLDANAAAEFARVHPRLALEHPTPAVDGGAFPVKRCTGEVVTVEIDVIGDGHDKLGVALQWRGPDDAEWSETRMSPLGNDRWQASFPLGVIGLHRYRVQAWRDNFATFRDELAKKHNAGVPIALELREGALLVDETLADGADPRAALERAGDDDARRTTLLDPTTERAMTAADPRPHSVLSAEIPVDAERTGAGFASWYEVFPRSLSDDPRRHGTFRDVERHLPRIRGMGFDVLYFPPIHPIGRTNRKGPNNTLTPGPNDPGSPYAIGAAEGGHDALHPELGSFEDFRHLREAAAAHGLEIAIDFAIQCSPDHPWLREHPDWFTWRPDGTIRYAENPPKKYQDIVNVDFYAAGAVPGLWAELARTVLFWCEHGVRLFRVDNPHTKAFPFWQWMIGVVRSRYPEAVFLAEAFTRPKIMARLAKVGFSQSYTYFTWRNSKAELTAYLTELADGPLRDFFRPHFFVNTPDINPFFLQGGSRASFLIRAGLAATLSGLWGVYNGFELCEGTPLAAGKEEYLDSEKFQLRAWDWNRPGNIVAEITRLNAIRRANPALQTHLGVTFHPSSSDAVLFFEKATPDRSNVLLIAVSLDPGAAHDSSIELPLWRSGLPDHATLRLDDLLTDRSFELTGKYQSVRLDPSMPYAIWRIAAPERV